jgi:RAC serine/threonine-protein kinase
MLTGKFPFKKNKDNKRFIYQKVNFDLNFTISNNAKDLISKLLDYDVEKRLTNPLLIMNHNFFSGIDWDDIYNKKVVPDTGYSSNISNKSVEE